MVTTWEKYGSGGGTDSTKKDSVTDLIFISRLDPGEDDLDVKAAVVLSSPLTYDGLRRRSLSHQQIGPALWESVVHYVDPDREKDELELRFSFDTGGGTAHASHSRQTISRTPAPGKTAPDFQGAINVNGDNVDGVDLTIPALRLDVKVKMPKATITLAYIQQLYKLTGKTNNDAWKGFATGELLFLGAQGEEATNSDPEISFAFLASENANNISVGNITVPAKKGHEFLWVYFAPEIDGAANKLTQRPLAAYVERVYEAGDYSLFGLGT